MIEVQIKTNTKMSDNLFLYNKSSNQCHVWQCSCLLSGSVYPPLVIYCRHGIICAATTYTCYVVITCNHTMISHTIFLQLPVAVHLSLSLNPVSAVCPQSGLGLSNHSSAWGGGETAAVLWRGEQQQWITSAYKCQSRLRVMRDVPANLEQCVGGNTKVR